MPFTPFVGADVSALFKRANPMMGGMSRHRVELLCLLLTLQDAAVLEWRSRRAGRIRQLLAGGIWCRAGLSSPVITLAAEAPPCATPLSAA
jgi:hypothetical protein